jgi:hypothetical protein
MNEWMNELQHNPNGRITPVLQLTTQQPYQPQRQELFCFSVILMCFDRLTIWGDVWLEML